MTRFQEISRPPTRHLAPAPVPARRSSPPAVARRHHVFGRDGFPKNAAVAWGLLVLLGFAELALCFYGAHAQNRHRITTAYVTALAQAVPYLLACALAWRWRRTTSPRGRPAAGQRTFFWTAVLFALGFRLVVGFGTRPYLSTDVYRYVWNGRVQAAGINPYRYPPDDPALADRRDAEVFPRINRPDARTIYPPGAEALFFVASGFGRGGVGTVKLAMVALEALALWALCRLLDGFGQPRERALLYAWHPLAVWEFAGSGHVDAAVIACVALALLLVCRRHQRRRGWTEALTGVALAGATLVKLFPLALFPALYRRWGWRLPAALAAVVAAFYAPHFWAVGWRTVFDFLLHGYAAEEGIRNGERFFLLALAQRLTGQRMPLVGFELFAAAVLGVLAAWCLWTPPRDALSPVRRAAALATVFNVLLSPGYAWYFVWLVPFLVFLPRPSLWWLTCASFVLYANWLHTRVVDFFVIGCVLYLPAAALALGELAVVSLARRRASAVSSSPT